MERIKTMFLRLWKALRPQPKLPAENYDDPITSRPGSYGPCGMSFKR